MEYKNLKQNFPESSHAEPIVSGYFPTEARSWAMSTKFKKLVKWAGTPPQFREPETEYDFARSIGISLETLDTWKSHSAFSSLAHESLIGWIREKTPEAIGTLYQKISDGGADGKDIEFFIRLGWPYEK